MARQPALRTLRRRRNDAQRRDDDAPARRRRQARTTTNRSTTPSRRTTRRSRTLLLRAGARVNGTNALGRVLDFDKLDDLRLMLEHGGDANERPLGASRDPARTIDRARTRAARCRREHASVERTRRQPLPLRQRPSAAPTSCSSCATRASTNRSTTPSSSSRPARAAMSVPRAPCSRARRTSSVVSRRVSCRRCPSSRATGNLAAVRTMLAARLAARDQDRVERDCTQSRRLSRRRRDGGPAARRRRGLANAARLQGQRHRHALVGLAGRIDGGARAARLHWLRARPARARRPRSESSGKSDYTFSDDVTAVFDEWRVQSREQSIARPT